MDAVKTDGTLLGSASRVATTNSPDQVSITARGVLVYIDATTIASTETVTPKLQGKDFLSGNYVDIVAFSAISATGTYVKAVHPTAITSGAANYEGKANPLPKTWRIVFTHSSTGAHVYSASFSYLV